jgi:ATP-dependent Lhr-like helicase
MFFRQLSDATGSSDDVQLLLDLWELVWAGWASNDTFAPLRALSSGLRPGRSHPRRRGRGPSMPVRSGPPAGAGRWSLVAARAEDQTRRTHALAEQLLSRYGIVTPAVVNAERVPGGFSAVYTVLKAMEEAGRCRRGYFVEGLGGAQFALPGAVDRMRSMSDIARRDAQTEVVAATDPANPYGASLPWPERDGGHRAGRKAGAVVVLVGGMLAIYVEKGGRTLLSYTDDPEDLQPAVDALALAARDGMLGKLSVERADGSDVLDTPFARALVQAGFRPSSRGLRLRA